MVTAQLNRKFVLDQMHEAIATISRVADGVEAEESEGLCTGQLVHSIDTFAVRGGASGSHERCLYCRQCWSSH